MAHDHHHHAHTAQNLSLAFWINTAFAVLELVGGLYTNSVAILSDALHDFGDSLSLGLSWYFHNKSRKKRDATFSYGYRRFSLLGAFISGGVLLIGSSFVVVESVERLLSPAQPDAGGMMVLAVIGVVVNGAAMLRLRRGSSVSEKVVSLHFLEDVLGWVAVLVGSIVMYFTDLPILDPILSIGIAVYILINVFRNFGEVFRILLQGIPDAISEDTIRTHILDVPGVCNVHDLHTWTLDGHDHILTLHVVVKAGTSLAEAEQIKSAVRSCLHHLHVHHSTVEIESENINCALEHC